jgi:hypothetical protein
VTLGFLRAYLSHFMALKSYSQWCSMNWMKTRGSHRFVRLSSAHTIAQHSAVQCGYVASAECVAGDDGCVRCMHLSRRYGSEQSHLRPEA